ncbi:MAG: mannose-6-phosphate isomerase [Clostridia bacterium]|nr:mannose-6-phosphate isomerase [Clostridia bacterium]
MKAYPLKLKPYYKDVIWGGTALKKKYKMDLPTNTIGEAWELSSREGYDCTVLNGEYKSKTLREYLSDNGCNPDEFPLLVKLIDANQDLSVQVHKSKTEMWYIIDAVRGAKLVYGLKEDTTVKTLFSAVETGNPKEISSLLNYVTVHPGEVYFIPKGLVHAIGAGILIAEIQENEDSTYRLYDYDRTDAEGNKRELHIKQAKETVNPISEAKIYAQRFAKGRSSEATLVNCDTFCVKRHIIRTSLPMENKSYTHILCMDGDGDISGVPIKQGESILIPKGMDSFITKANRPMSVLISRAN